MITPMIAAKAYAAAQAQASPMDGADAADAPAAKAGGATSPRWCRA